MKTINTLAEKIFWFYTGSACIGFTITHHQ
nr:MAG TPA: hypothetical protein [Caudoviricetes sp.]